MKGFESAFVVGEGNRMDEPVELDVFRGQFIGYGLNLVFVLNIAHENPPPVEPFGK